jgi:hypothetical protein
MSRVASFCVLSVSAALFAPSPALACQTGAKAGMCQEHMGHMSQMGHMGKKREMGAMRGRHMHRMIKGGVWAGPEVAYLPGLQLGAAGLATGGSPTIEIGRTRQWELNDFFSLGGASGAFAQAGLGSSGTGPWITPYWGFLPRVGFGLGPLRLDVGAMAGAGGMFRTTTIGTSADVLQARLIWLLAPRIELGYRGERFGAGLTGSYLITPVMGDLGGVSVGARLTFGGGGKPWGDEDDEDDHEEGSGDDGKKQEEGSADDGKKQE